MIHTVTVRKCLFDRWVPLTVPFDAAQLTLIKERSSKISFDEYYSGIQNRVSIILFNNFSNQPHISLSLS